MQVASATPGVRDISEIKKRILSSEVEQQNYQTSLKLCYLYEFRQKNNLSLRATDPLREDQLIKRNLGTDPQLAETLATRRQLLLPSLITAVDGADPQSIVLLRSERIQTLVASPGFALAMRECSDRLNVDVKTLATRDLNTGDLVLANLAPLLAGGAILRGAFIVVSRASAAVGLSQLLRTLGINTAYLATGATMAAVALPTYVAIEEINRQQELLNQIRQDLKNGATPDDSILEQWAQKRWDMAQLIRKYSLLQHQQGSEADHRDFAHLLDVNAEVRPMLVKKLRDLTACHSQKDLDEVLRGLKQKAADGEELTSSEELDQEELLLLVLIQTTLKILDEQRGPRTSSN